MAITTYVARMLTDGTAAVLESRAAELSADAIFLLTEEVEVRLGGCRASGCTRRRRGSRGRPAASPGGRAPSGRREAAFELTFEQCEPGFRSAVAAILNGITD